MKELVLSFGEFGRRRWVFDRHARGRVILASTSSYTSLMILVLATAFVPSHTADRVSGGGASACKVLLGSKKVVMATAPTAAVGSAAR